VDPGLRQQLFLQVHRIYLTQFPFIMLYSAKDCALAPSGIHSYLPELYTDTHNIGEWWCRQGGKSYQLHISYPEIVRSKIQAHKQLNKIAKGSLRQFIVLYLFDLSIE
jgi:hypothetical protein